MKDRDLSDNWRLYTWFNCIYLSGGTRRKVGVSSKESSSDSISEDDEEEEEEEEDEDVEEMDNDEPVDKKGESFTYVPYCYPIISIRKISEY